MDIRRQRTRALLVQAFEELSRTKALQEISVSEICELATVRRGTFYKHFEDKDDFFRYYLTTITADIVEQLSAGESLDDLWEYASYMHVSLARMLIGDRGMRRNLEGGGVPAGVLDMVVAQIADGIVTRIELWCKREGVTLKTSAEFVGDFYSAGLVHTMRAWMSKGQPFPPEELERRCTEFLRRYLETEPSNVEGCTRR